MTDTNALWQSVASRVSGLLGRSPKDTIQDDVAVLFADPALDDGFGDFAGMPGQLPAGNSLLPLPLPRSSWEPTGADRIYRAFDASQPVANPSDLRGRDREIAALLSGVLHRHNHGLVAGPRGSGKTSLVRVFGDHAEREGVRVVYAACDGGSTWGELLRDLLQQVPSYLVQGDGVRTFEERIANVDANISPLQATNILSQIAYSHLVMIVDEFDRVEDRNFHSRMASMMKLLSDARVPVRLVLVGASSSFNEIVGEHASLVRHITRLTTDPLSPADISDLLDRCAEGCEMHFSSAGRELLADVVCGSPYHARLFGMHAALEALRHNQSEIGVEAVKSGLDRSFDEWAELNRDDAKLFRALLKRSKRDANAGVETARAVALGGSVRAVGSLGGPLEERQRAVDVLGPAIETTDHGIAFKDSTAPQYLIALSRVSSVGSDRVQEEVLRSV